MPSGLVTCSADGTPNATIISQVFYVDPRHVAVSCQFFNKTHRNLRENPQATVEMWDPVTFEAYRLSLRYLRSETDGPIFDVMSNRIDAIASQTGMAGIFKLRSADICEVISTLKVEGFHDAPPETEDEGPDSAEGPMTELRALSLVSARINKARDLDGLLKDVLSAFDELFRLRHSMVLAYEEPCGVLVTLASHGYGAEGVGAEVRLGEGLIGTVAERRVPLRLLGVETQLRYSRAIRKSFQREHGSSGLSSEIPLPGLPDAQAQLALPLLLEDRLLGVLAIESRDPLAFADWHEAFLQVLANQVAMGVERLLEPKDEEVEASARKVEGPSRAAPQPQTSRKFLYYRADDCVFVDGEYLIRNVPGRILWRLLTAHRQEGRREFTNRELRLDASLGLPAYKDNLETRLILLRKRLLEKCPDVRIVPVRRGRFALEVDCEVELSERDAG